MIYIPSTMYMFRFVIGKCECCILECLLQYGIDFELCISYISGW